MLNGRPFSAFPIGLSICPAQETNSTRIFLFNAAASAKRPDASGTERGTAVAADQASALAAYVRSFNADTFETSTPGAGERFFFGKGNCGSCHMAGGRGKFVGAWKASTGELA
jgi:mono/diheme cytochrome c family protein